MTEFLVRRAGLITAVLCAVLAAALFARPFVREAGTPYELRFAPGDATLTVLAPDPGELMAQLHTHLCPFTQEYPEACALRPTPVPDGPIREAICNERDDCYSDDEEFAAPSMYALLADIDRTGLEVSAPMMLSMRGPMTAFDGVFVASLKQAADGDDDVCPDFLDAVSEFLDADTGGIREDVPVCSLTPGSEPTGVFEPYDGPKIYFKRIDEGRIALYTNPAAFEVVWRYRHRPSKLFSQDSFASVFREIATGGSPPLWGYIRNAGLSAAAPSAFALTFGAPPEGEALNSQQLANAREALTQAFEGTLDFTTTTFLEGAGGMRFTVWLGPNSLYSRHLSDFLTEAPDRAGGFSDLGNGAGAAIAANDVMQYFRFAQTGFGRPLQEFLFEDEDAPFADYSRFSSVAEALVPMTTIAAIDVQAAGFRDRIPDIVLRLQISESEMRDLIERIRVSEGMLASGELGDRAAPGGGGSPDDDGCFDQASSCTGLQRFHFLQPSRVGNDEYRLVATFDPATETLWIASGTETLQSATRSASVQSLGNRRMQVRITPRRLADLLKAQEYDTSDDLSSLYLLTEELAQYSHVEFSLSVMEKERGARLDFAIVR